MSQNKDKIKLSKGVLEMRFMKRTRERLEKEAEDATAANLLAATSTQVETGKGRAFKDDSFIKCLDLRDGRFSYRGMNPIIEALMDPKTGEDKSVPEVDITDREMAAMKNPLVNSMGKKFLKKSDKHDTNKHSKDKPNLKDTTPFKRCVKFKSKPKMRKFIKPKE